MALRGDAQGDRVVFAGPWPAIRPLTVCGFAQRLGLASAGSDHLLSFGQGAQELSIFGLHGYGAALNFGWWCGVGGPYYVEVFDTGLVTNDQFFYALRIPSGSGSGVGPTIFWRQLPGGALSSSYLGDFDSGWTFTPIQLELFSSSLANVAARWDGRQCGLRVFSRALSNAEILTESYSLLPRSWNGIVLAAPMVADARDISVYGGGRSGTMTGITVEAGPPVGWGR